MNNGNGSIIYPDIGNRKLYFLNVKPQEKGNLSFKMFNRFKNVKQVYYVIFYKILKRLYYKKLFYHYYNHRN